MARTTRRRFLAAAAGALGVASVRAQVQGAAPAVDHHQHLFGPFTASLSPSTPRSDADALLRLLDAAGIGRAVVLSTAYQFSNPNRPPLEDEYAKVRAENDWTAQQVARHTDRLVGFCAVNPLKEYADAEIRRCADMASLRTGLKLHFGNSDVQLDQPEHVSKVQAVFARANAARMALVVHVHGSFNQSRPHGARQMTTFLEQLLPAVPDVPVQIAHFTSAAGYDNDDHAAMGVLAGAVQRSDPRARRLYFDASGITLREGLTHATEIVDRIRQVGVQRVLFGSDGTAEFLRPVEAWAALAKLPLTATEVAAIAANVAPYLRR